MQSETSWSEVRSHKSPLGLGQIRIDTVKPIVRKCDLVSEGRAASAILTPPDPAYFDLAYRIAEKVEAETGARVPILSAASAVSDDGTLTVDADRTLIVLGNIVNNALMGELYHFRLVACDALYPGRGGWVARTVYDPWGCGKNLLVLGGSDYAGCEQAVAYLCGAIRFERKTAWVANFLKIELGAEFLNRYPNIASEASAEYIQQQVVAGYEQLEKTGKLTNQVAHSGFMYHLTGDDGFAVLYRELFKMMYIQALKDTGEGMWSPWGRASDFQSNIMVPAWDIVEASPIFTDEDRLYITNHMLEYLHNNVKEVNGHRPADLNTSRHNHYTFAAIGLLYGAKYFQRYYGWREVPEWIEMADDCFRPQVRAWKANEDCNSYQWLTFYHALQYAFIRPCRSYLSDGFARRCLDYGIMTMDNLGYQVPYGDCAGHGGSFSEIPYYKAVAWALGDPMYREILDRKGTVRPPHGTGGLYPVGFEYDADWGDLRPRPADRLKGVKAVPVDFTYYHTHRKQADLPIEACFDKISFRQSLDADADYLLLDGLSNGGHHHHDGNAIVRLTSDGRIWLADADYMKTPQKFHNTVMVFKEGRSHLIPPYTRLVKTAELPGYGYSATRVEDFNGVDWTRHIFWRHETYFLVFDELRAKEAGAFDFRIVFRTVGQVDLDADAGRLTVTQDGKRFQVQSGGGWATGVRHRVIDEPIIWGSWDQYEHGDGSRLIRVFEEKIAAGLASGDRLVYGNVLNAQSKASVEGVSQVGAGMLAMATGEGRVVAGIPSSAGCYRLVNAASEAQHVDVDAGFVHACGAEIVALSMRRLAIGEEIALVLDRPQDVVVRFREGDVTIDLAVDADSVLRFEAVAAFGVETVILDGSPLTDLDSYDREGGKLSIAAGRHTLVLPIGFAFAVAESAVETPQASYDRALPTEGHRAVSPECNWVYAQAGDVPYAVDGGDLDGDREEETVAGWESGKVVGLKQGEVVWTFETGGRIHDVRVADVDGDGKPEVIVGSADEHVYLLSGDGTERWRRHLPYYEHVPVVKTVLCADLGLGRGRAVVVGTDASRFYAFTPTGEELWRYYINHGRPMRVRWMWTETGWRRSWR